MAVARPLRARCRRQDRRGRTPLPPTSPGPHAYAWQVGSAAGDAFARIFEGGTVGDGEAAAGPTPGPGERINVLIVGIDKTPRRPATLTDTMIVASLDPVGKSISMVSIPRDMVNVPLGNGNEFGPKLNSLYAYAGSHP